jgi:phosphatidylglycerol:prolipoprotein diacylglycerol transferase
MKSLLEYYQNIPLHIDPVAFTISSFPVGWYAVMYMLAFLIAYLLLMYRTKKKEGIYDKDLIIDFMILALVAALLGGRLGYVLLYNPVYYFHNLWSIISPYDFVTGEFIGIYGMSYHGGLLAIIVAGFIFLRKKLINNKPINFWRFADFVVPVIPAGYFFGRIGNFLNLELYGRITNSWIGMYFPIFTGAGQFLRFPSQLLEALLEGAVLFIILWSIRNRSKFSGQLLAVYLVGYGFFRMMAEFFREPDEQIGLLLQYFTLGQIFSLLMICVGISVYFWRKNKIIDYLS